MKIKYGLYDQDQTAITGSTVLKCKIKRDADDYFWDWNDSTFKAAGWVTIAAQMSEPDVTNAPGEYEKSVDESGWNDGKYTVYVNYTGTPKQNGSDEVRVVDGAEYDLFLQRLFQALCYKMIITNSTGAVALRNKADDADIATGSLTDNGTLTIRAKLVWS